MKVKPIVLIGIPFASKQQISELESHEKIKSLKFDYHVLIINISDDKLKFEVFYEKDFNHVKFEELKELVNKLTR